MVLELLVPVNTAAVLVLPGPVNTAAVLVLPGPGTLTEDGKPAAAADGVEEAAGREGRPAFGLAAGRYRFVFRPGG